MHRRTGGSDVLARLPWTPTLKPPSKPKPRKLNRDRQRHLVESTAFILRLGEPTYFAFEGACRHDLRSRLCLEGWAWQDADTAAAEIVSSALNRIGATRPSWIQGQPEYAHAAAERQEHVRCRNCGGGMPPENAIFCSSQCRISHKRKRYYQDNIELARAKQRLRWKAWSARQPEQECPMCAEVFRPNYPGQHLCSKRCAVRKMRNFARARS